MKPNKEFSSLLTFNKENHDFRSLTIRESEQEMDLIFRSTTVISDPHNASVNNVFSLNSTTNSHQLVPQFVAKTVTITFQAEFPANNPNRLFLT
jgi:hypothetical protein